MPSMRLLAYLPAACLEHLGERKLVAIELVPKVLVDLYTEPVQKTHCDAAPLHNNVVARLEHRRNLYRLDICPAAVLVVVLEAPLRIVGLQRKNTEVNKETAVAVFRKTGQ